MTRDEYVQQLKDVFVKAGGAVYDWVVLQVPFLGKWFVRPLTKWFINLTLNAVVNTTETAAFFLYIDIRVNRQGRDFEAAAANYHKIKKTGTPGEIKNAERILMQKFAEFVSLKS